jgi:hypothetical protein
MITGVNNGMKHRNEVMSCRRNEIIGIQFILCGTLRNSLPASCLAMFRKGIAKERKAVIINTFRATNIDHCNIIYIFMETSKP